MWAILLPASDGRTSIVAKGRECSVVERRYSDKNSETLIQTASPAYQDIKQVPAAALCGRRPALAGRIRRRQRQRRACVAHVQRHSGPFLQRLTCDSAHLGWSDLIFEMAF